MRSLTSILSSSCVALLLVGGSAWAAGSDNSTPTTPTETTQKCKDGQVWDAETKACVTAKESRFDDRQLFEFAREFAYAGQYQHTISILRLAANPQDPRILNYMGYAHRKAGLVEVGMGYYREALKRDPDYVLARSYMGQAFAEMGHLTLARQQLNEIEARAGRETYAYLALAKTLAGKNAY